MTGVDLELLGTDADQVVDVDGLGGWVNCGGLRSGSYLSYRLGGGSGEAEVGLVMEGLGVDAVVQ